MDSELFTYASEVNHLRKENGLPLRDMREVMKERAYHLKIVTTNDLVKNNKHIYVMYFNVAYMEAVVNHGASFVCTRIGDSIVRKKAMKNFMEYLSRKY